jgi:hypothetical protein
MYFLFFDLSGSIFQFINVRNKLNHLLMVSHFDVNYECCTVLESVLYCAGKCVKIPNNAIYCAEKRMEQRIDMI